MNKLPTSNFDEFRQHLLSPNQPFEINGQDSKILRVNKNLVLSYVSDSTGCGHIRNIFPMTYMNSLFGKTGNFNVVISPVMIFQHDILMKTRSIFFQRTMNPMQKQAVQMYKQNKSKYGYKMIYDIDDFIWNGPDEGESIPDYNFGGRSITDDVRRASLEIMNEMDIVCVSTQFLGDYIRNHGVDKPEIKVVYNTVPQYFWGPYRKRPIKKRIEKPRVIYTGSPTHYNNQDRLKGDWENQWCEWVINAVKENRIEFLCMGGLPFFFEGIKNRSNFKIVDWVNSYQYALPIKEFRPDFGLAPLVPNYFNYSKSCIKYQEYCAVGALGIGTVFTNGKPSPYDVNIVKVPDNISIKQIDELFDEYTEPEKYNSVIKEQYKQIDENGWWLESPKYIKMMTEIF
jgi:hypothetical protein